MNSMTTTRSQIPDYITYLYEGEARITGVDADGFTALIAAHTSDDADIIRRDMGRHWVAVEYDPDLGYKWERRVIETVRMQYEDAWRRIRSGGMTYINAGASAAWKSWEMRKSADLPQSNHALRGRMAAYRSNRANDLTSWSGWTLD